MTGHTYRRVVRPFAVIPSELFRDRTLSLAAKGLMGLLLDLPAEWLPKADDLARRSLDSRYAVLKARKELIDAGWLVEERTQDTRGRWSTRTIILDHPISGDERQRLATVEAMDRQYRREIEGQGALDLDGGEHPQPVDDPGDNEPEPEPETPTGMRDPASGADQQLRDPDDREPAGQTGSPMPGPGETHSLGSNQEANKHRARESAQVLDRVTARFTAQQRHALERRRHPTLRAIADALDAGWTPDALRDHLERACAEAHNPGGMLTWQLGNLPPPAPAYNHPPPCDQVLPSWWHDRPEDYTRDAGHADAIREQYPWLTKR